MPYRNLPKKIAEKRAYSFKTLVEKFNCLKGKHEYAFKHVSMKRPHWTTNLPYGFCPTGWLTGTKLGIQYYRTTVFCSCCNKTFKTEEDSINVLWGKLDFGRLMDITDAWEKYVALHNL